MMGTIETKIDRVKDLTVQTVHGEILAAEIRDAIINYYQGTPTGLILWDFTDASLKSIRLDDVKELVILTKRYSHLRPHGKTAMLFSSSLGYGLGRMFDIQKSISDPNVDHMTFDDREAAFEWLGVTEQDK